MSDGDDRARPPRDANPHDPAHGGEGGPTEEGEAVPWGQRFYDRPFLLLALGVLIMFLSFTGWGLLEILRLTPAPLP